MTKRIKQLVTASLLFICIVVMMCASAQFVAMADTGNEPNVDNPESVSDDYVVETLPDGHTTMVSGHITIEKNESEAIMPLKHVKVSLWDKDPLINDFIDTTYTDENGFYQFFFQDGHGLFENKDDLQVRVFAAGETFTIFNFTNYSLYNAIESFDFAFSYYAEKDIVDNIVPGTSTSGLDVNIEYADNDTHKAFIVSQSLVDVQKFVYDFADMTIDGRVYVFYPFEPAEILGNMADRMDSVLSKVKALFPDFEYEDLTEWLRNLAPDDAGSFCYNYIMGLARKSYHEPLTCMHEYAHFVEWRRGTYGLSTTFRLDLQLRGHTGTEESISKYQDKYFGMELAWSEGWATALAWQSLLYNNYDMGDDFNQAISPSSNFFENRGEAQENNITALLLDLYCPYPDKDTSLLTLGYSEFFRTSAKAGICDAHDFVYNLFREYPHKRDIIGQRLEKYAIAPKNVTITNMPKLHTPPTITFVGQGSRQFPNNIFTIMVFDDNDTLVWKSNDILAENLVCNNSLNNDDKETYEFEYTLPLEEWEEILTAFSTQHSAMNFAIGGYVDTPLAVLGLHYKTGPYVSGYCKLETFAGVQIDNHVYYRLYERDNATTAILEGIDSYLRRSASDFVVPTEIKGVDLIGIDSYAFEDCTGINSFAIPLTLSFIGDAALKNTGYWNNQSEGVITLNNWVIGYKGACPSHVVLASDLLGIADGCFRNATLENINLQNVIFIGDNAFANSLLQKVAIHANTVGIGSKAFINCSNLVEVDFYSNNPPEIGNSAFDNCSSRLAIYVIPTALSNYQSYNALGQYSNRIKNKQININYYNYDNTVFMTKSGIAFGVMDEYVYPSNRSGYAFEGWYDLQSDYAHEYSLGATWDSFENISLYPKWTLINYSLSYDCDGGTNTGNPLTYTINDSINLRPASKTGYSFNGWFDGSSQSIIDCITNRTGNLNLTACWVANAYTVSLDINCDDGTIVSNTVEATFDSLCSLPVPTRPNYVFDGWFDGVNSTSIQYSQADGLLIMNDGRWREANDKNLYARWTIKEYYVIVAEKINDAWDLDNYWNGSSLSTEQQYVTALQIRSSFGQTMRAYFNSAEGLKAGHRLLYFYTSWDNDFGNWVNLTMPDLGENRSTIIVYPKWEKEKHSILYKVNGMSYRQFYDVEYESNISVEAPSKEGYSFGGWYVEDLNGVFDNTQYANGTPFQYTLMPDLTPVEGADGGHIIVIASWIPKVTTFNLIVNNTIYTSFNVTVGTQISKLTAINKAGYEFVGWYDNTSFTGKIYYNGLLWVSDAPIVNLYPKYNIINYPITYNIDSDVECDCTRSTYTVTSSFQLSVPVKRGYRFVGWKTQNDQIISSILQGSTGKLVLTAQWAGVVVNAASTSYTTISYNNCLSDTVILDFSNYVKYVDKTFYIDSDINEITIKGTGRPLLNVSFVIKNRSNLLKFSLWNMNFSAKEGQDAIQTENAVDDIIIYTYGTYNQVAGGINTTNNASLYTCAIKITSNKLTIDGEENSSLNINGGNGKNGSTYGENGTNGGYGVSAKSIEVSTCNLTVKGGNGGNGYSGMNGTNGINGAAPPSSGGGVDGAKGGDGTNGTNGSIGSNGGHGSYAIKCTSIKKIGSCSIRCTGGDGGNGGVGGRGGNGGNGANGRDGRFAVYSGNGGNGGNGGAGGNGGCGGNASRAIAGSVLTSAITCYDGNVGIGGAGGAGGTGGAGGYGGKYYNQNKWRPNGSPGANGANGTAGANGTVV